MEGADIHLVEVDGDVVGTQSRRDSGDEFGGGFLCEG